MLFSSLRKRYETTPLFLFLVRPRMLHCTPAAGTAEHQGLHNQIRCFSGCGSQASYCVGIRSNGTLLRPPAQAPIACTVPSAQTAFHFIQIKFKRCNVRCSVARYYLTRPELICQIGRLHFVRYLTFFLCNFNSVSCKILFFKLFPPDFSLFFVYVLFMNF